MLCFVSNQQGTFQRSLPFSHMTQNTIWRPPISHQATILFLFLSLLYLGDLVNPLVADLSTTCFGEGAKFCKNETLTARSLTVGNATLRAYQSHRAQTAALDPGTTVFYTNRQKMLTFMSILFMLMPKGNYIVYVY